MFLPDYPINNNKVIADYNKIHYGHYETGKTVTCINSEILPNYNIDGYPIGSTGESLIHHPDKLNIIASEQINLLDGFHAKGSIDNFQVTNNFHAKIQPCLTIPQNQAMPLILNMNINSNDSFKENSLSSMDNMISYSYSNAGPFKSQVQIQDNNKKRLNSLELVDFSKDGISVYPNPSNNVVTVSVKSNMYKLLILDYTGKIVLEYNQCINDTEIDVSSLSKGVYLIKVISKEKIYESKLIKL